MSNLYVSDCGKYVARHDGGCRFDIMEIDGSNIWLTGRSQKDGEFPEFDKMFTAYSLIESNDSCSKWIFELSFADLDISKKVVGFTGNCIIKNYTAIFSRKIKFRKPKIINRGGKNYE